MEWEKEGYMISTDKEKIDVKYVHTILKQMYWSEDIPLNVVERSIKGSLCFAVYDQDKQVGFARVITDKATFAYLADVFIDPVYRGKGLSKWMMQTIVNHPELQGLRRFMLATKDAHSLYTQFGFTPITFPERWMQIHKPDVYKTT